ncbi:MAG: cytochrome c oxidase subunit 3 [Gammaproteobacteria bacterium]
MVHKQSAIPENYYVPEGSKLPFLTALSAGTMLSGVGMWTVGVSSGPVLAVVGLLGLIGLMLFWFNEVISENLAGLNSVQLKRSYVWGMSWFIFSEVMFFAGFFGALFYVRVFAVPWLGGEGDKGLAGDLLWPDFQAVWPVLQNPDPEVFTGPHQNLSWPGFASLYAWLPLWNTLVLITSSVTVTIAHHGLREGNRAKLNRWLLITLMLAVTFLGLQVAEYAHAYNDLGLTLNSGIYGSTFFLLTGFHGFHVLLGSIILAVMLFRSLKGHFRPDDHFGFEAASWYWHFVDVVWVLLFVFVYIL